MLMERQSKKNGRLVCGGVLAVLTRNTLAHLNEFYAFFRANKFNVKINPISYEGGGASGELGVKPNEFLKAMTYLFDRWFNEDGDVLTINPFDEILGNLIVGQPRGCLFAGACHNEFLSVAPNGDVYPCAGERNDEYRLGNINDQALEEIVASPVLTGFQTARTLASQTCKGCPYFGICHSGCARRGFMRRRRLSDRDYYCDGYKPLFSHIHKVLVDEPGSPLGTGRNEKVNVDAIQNPALRNSLKDRFFPDASKAKMWMDKTWNQWRGDYHVWSGDHKEWHGNWSLNHAGLHRQRRVIASVQENER
jgi:radical SAM protein with 4Fe4S-binding SPASM domain